MSEIKMLPLSEWLSERDEKTKLVARNYARAVAEHNVKERDAEIERLRAITDNREAIIATHAADTREYQKHLMHAEARAERLRADAERYRWLRNKDPSDPWRYMGGLSSKAMDTAIDRARRKEARNG